MEGDAVTHFFKAREKVFIASWWGHDNKHKSEDAKIDTPFDTAKDRDGRFPGEEPGRWVEAVTQEAVSRPSVTGC